MLIAGALALAIGLPFPEAGGVRWALAAGAIGGIGLALFYRGLAIGQMGVVAPISAVLGAALATVVAAFTEGVPRHPSSSRLPARRNRRLADLTHRRQRLRKERFRKK